MGYKPTVAPSIFMNGDDITKDRKDVSQSEWEWGIDNALKNLFQVVPVQCSRPVLWAIAQSGKKVLIRPALPGEAHEEPVKGIDFNEGAVDVRNATPQGSPPRACDGEGMSGKDFTGTLIPGDPGTGAGANACVYFTSQDYHWNQVALPGGRPDEALLHELVHALRDARGFSLCLPMSDNYDTVEEFYAMPHREHLPIRMRIFYPAGEPPWQVRSSL